MESGDAAIWLTPAHRADDHCIVELSRKPLARLGGVVTLALTDIPDLLIPRDLIRFFDHSLCDISLFRVFAHVSDKSRYVGLISIQDAMVEEFFERHQDQTLSSLLGAVCDLHYVRGFTFLEGQYISADQDWSAVIDRRLGGHAHSSEKLCRSPSAAAPPQAQAPDSPHRSLGGLSEVRSCPLCLEPFDRDAPHAFTTFCQHSFHTQCLLRLEGYQCPVCRFEHDHSFQRCECSVCGCDDDGDLWLCLLCGFVGCGELHAQHNRQHYVETQHTYAMQLDQLTVWDFSGEGFVDRLLLGHLDEADGDRGNEGGVASGGGTSKIIEHRSPHEPFSEFRSQLPVSDHAQEQMVHQKVSGVISQFNRVLAWRMQQSRLFYEERIRQIRRMVPVAPVSAQPPRQGAGRAWRLNVKASLTNEASQIRKHCELLRQKLRVLEKERDAQEEMRRGLEENRRMWERKAQEAERECLATQERCATEVGVLEAKLQAVLVRMETCDDR